MIRLTECPPTLGATGAPRAFILRSTAAFLLTVLTISTISITLKGQAPSTQEPSFEGTFETLRPEQQRLVADWCTRLAAATKQSVDPATLYNTLPVSTRTTFNSVTHALMRTSLTDEQGRSLGASALTIISHIDGVAGRIVGARGDEQFRIYVQLTPGTLDRLDQSREFDRSADNTVYHQGYPTSYRSRGGTPSIQVSIASDGTIGDIDVDYRSSKFPVFLINGHLASSNSDIRAGDNDERHNGRWTGMNAWWRDLVRLVSPDDPTSTAADPALTPIEIIKKDARPADAMQAFLATWLVERRPAEIVNFFADDIVACMELDSATAVDRGMMRFSILHSLQANNAKIGEVSAVTQVTQGVEMPGSRIRRVAHGHEDAFTLYDVREDLAEELKCGTRLHPEEVSPKALKSQAYGKYVAAVFRMKLGQTAGQTFALLLSKNRGYWKILAYTADPLGDVTRSINLLRPAPTAAPATTFAADPEFLRAATDFHQQWFAHGRVDAALAYLTPQSLPCINPFLDDGVARPATAEARRELIRTGMQRTLTLAGGARKLDQSIAAVPVLHPDLRQVRHGNARAFAAAALPDALAAQVACEVTETAAGSARIRATIGPPAYGTFYITGFKMANVVEESGTLVCIWRKDGGTWKIVSFALLTP